MLYIVANPLSGGGKGQKYLTLTEEYFKQNDIEYKLLISTYATETIVHGKTCAQDRRCTRAAVLGGDGTFNEFINGFGDCKKPVGFIAAGTGNDFIRAMGIPRDPVEAAKIISGGQIRTTDIIDFGDRLCLNILGTGLDVELLMRANRYRKAFKGSLSYYLSLLVTLFTFKNRDYTFSIDGGEKRTVRAMMVSIANGRYCGGGLPVAPEGITDDGKIDFVIIKKVNRFKLPYLFIKFLKGKLLAIKCVEFHRCTSVALDVNPPLPINCDGELLKKLPLTAVIKPKTLNILCPAKELPYI